MSLVNGRGEPETPETDPERPNRREGSRALENGPAPRQATWFGITEGPPMPEGLFAGVVFNRPIDQVLSYHVPSGLERIIRPGQRLRVPLGQGNKLTVGYCVRVDPVAPADLDAARIKDVAEVLDPSPLIDSSMLALTRWIADYYACSWGQALDAVVPAGVKKHAGTRIATFLMVPDEIREALLAGSIQPPLTPKQAAVMEVLGRGELLSVADVCRQAKCAPGLVHGMRGRGLVRPVRKRLPVGFAAVSPSWAATTPLEMQSGGHRAGERGLVLTSEQKAALGLINRRDRGGWVCAVPDPRSDGQRQDRGVPGGDRTGCGTGARGDRACA